MVHKKTPNRYTNPKKGRPLPPFALSEDDPIVVECYHKVTSNLGHFWQRYGRMEEFMEARFYTHSPDDPWAVEAGYFQFESGEAITAFLLKLSAYKTGK